MRSCCRNTAAPLPSSIVTSRCRSIALAHAAAVAARYFDDLERRDRHCVPTILLRTSSRVSPLQNFEVKLREFAFDHRIDPASAVAALNDHEARGRP